MLEGTLSRILTLLFIRMSKIMEYLQASMLNLYK
jgi:hypothetical protein